MSEQFPTLEDVAKTLVENGAVYVAANKQSLVDEPVQIRYHLPVGVTDEQKDAIATYLQEELGQKIHDRQSGNVRIDEQPKSAVASNALRNDLHLYRRVPVYVKRGVPGLDPVLLDEGVTNARRVASDKSDVEPRPNETLPLETLLKRLADAGAGSVEMATEFLAIGEPQIELRVPIVPAEGKPIVGPVTSVTVAGEEYPFNATLTLDGPYGSSLGWESLYVSDSVCGLESLSVEDGAHRASDLLALARDADSLRDFDRAREGQDKDAAHE